MLEAEQPSRIQFDVEFLRAAPQDMEWVAENAEVYFYQVEDVTAVSSASSAP